MMSRALLDMVYIDKMKYVKKSNSTPLPYGLYTWAIFYVIDVMIPPLLIIDSVDASKEVNKSKNIL